MLDNEIFWEVAMPSEWKNTTSGLQDFTKTKILMSSSEDPLNKYGFEINA